MACFGGLRSGHYRVEIRGMFGRVKGLSVPGLDVSLDTIDTAEEIRAEAQKGEKKAETEADARVEVLQNTRRKPQIRLQASGPKCLWSRTNCQSGAVSNKRCEFASALWPNEPAHDGSDASARHSEGN